MEKYSIEDIQKRVKELALKINVPEYLLPTFEHLRGDGTPCIEVDSKGFMYYVISERGQEFERRKTGKINDLLYWIFSDVTSLMSFRYELENRIEDKDCRRLAFNKQLELLGLLDNDWKEKEKNEHQIILKSFPFDDFALLRANLLSQLRKQGYSEMEIEKIAYEKYPR